MALDTAEPPAARAESVPASATLAAQEFVREADVGGVLLQLHY